MKLGRIHVWMTALLRFLVLAGVKVLSRTFYSFDVEWVGSRRRKPFHDVRLALLLNHTSLFEPVYTGVLPFGFLWATARRGVMPAADITMNRPFIGGFYKAIVPNAVSITRRRDKTWTAFLEKIGRNSVVLIAPEGRMKRRNGLDKHGRPMTVRAGIADILEALEGGNMLVAYAEGLHHIQTPGEGFPKLFKRARIRFEVLAVAAYKKELAAGTDGFRKRVVKDLHLRRDRHCPWNGGD